MTTKRRAKGSGSIVFKEGKWCAIVALPKTADGRRRRRWIRSGRFCDVLAAVSEQGWRPATATQGGRKAGIAQARELGTHTEAEWWALVRAVERRCFYCGVETSPSWRTKKTDPDYRNMDHKVPLSRGGSDAIDNIAVACRRCNAEKGMMTADEYAAWRRSVA